MRCRSAASVRFNTVPIVSDTVGHKQTFNDRHYESAECGEGGTRLPTIPINRYVRADLCVLGLKLTAATVIIIIIISSAERRQQIESALIS